MAVDCSLTGLGRCLQRLELQLLAARRTLAAATEQHEVAQVGLAAGYAAKLRCIGIGFLPSMILMRGYSLGCSGAVPCGTHP